MQEQNVSGPLAEAVEHLRRGRPAQAVQVLEALVEREPDNAAAHQELAVAQFKLVRFGPAAKAARRALELDPSLHRPHGILAWVALNKGRYEQAQAELQAQLEALPAEEPGQRAAVHNQMGFLYFRQKRYEEAERALGQVLALVPERAAPRLNLAMVHLRLKRWDAAEEELEQLLALPEVPENAAHTAHFNLGHLYARRGRYKLTREQFARALEIRRSLPAYIYRAIPVLARLPISVLAVVGLILLLVVWNVLIRVV